MIHTVSYYHSKLMITVNSQYNKPFRGKCQILYFWKFVIYFIYPSRCHCLLHWTELGVYKACWCVYVQWLCCKYKKNTLQRVPTVFRCTLSIMTLSSAGGRDACLISSHLSHLRLISRNKAFVYLNFAVPMFVI